MARRAVVLISGGLDSTLAVRILQEQGIEVEGLNFQTLFTCCRDDAARVAGELGIRLTVVSARDDYIELIRKPRYGYGKGANPCVDCRIYMFQIARQFMQQAGADFIASGEVLGQRPKSQKRRDLLAIAADAELEDLLLRPLSARLLPLSLPEREGWVDREQLYGFVGRGRKPLIRLARELGITRIPSPSTGCSLTETTFAGKVRDLVQLDRESQRWDFELLNVGRHLRLDLQTKAVVGRREQENAVLEHMFQAPESRPSLMLAPHAFKGPAVLVIGPATESTVQAAGALVLRYGKEYDPTAAMVEVHRPDGERRLVQVFEQDAIDQLATL